jgi:hypothetical protein
MENTGANGPVTGSTLGRFVQTLMNEGRARVSPQPLLEDEGDVLAWLAELEANARFELATEAPAFQEASALWAARLFYQLCQFVVCRDLGEDLIVGACEVPCPQTRDPETDWSADLTLRHLPRLFELARHLSNADPLVYQLRLLGRAWPLSSVGMPGLDNLQLDSFIGHPALRRLYADRILAAGDYTRLGDGRVDDRLRADLGAHRNLAPEIAARLFNARETAICP